MCARGNIRHFLQQRQGYLAEKIHIRRLLLSESLRGIFTNDERESIVKEESESTKTNLFLKTLFCKDDNALFKLMESLWEKQPSLGILQEWGDYQQQTDQSDRLQSVREPIESIDDSMMETNSFNIQCKDEKPLECKCDLKPDPLTPKNSMLNIPPLTLSSSEKELNISGPCADDVRLTADILNNIGRLVTLNQDERSSLENRLNQALQDQDLIRDSNQKLLDVLVDVVKQGKLSPHVVEKVLREVDQEQLAEKLLNLTVRDKYLHDMSEATWTKLKQELSVENASLEGNTWKNLPEWLGIKHEVNIKYLDQRYKCPAEEILHIWMKKRCATVVNLYNILHDNGLQIAAEILIPELPVSFSHPEYEHSLSTCSSNSGY